MRAYVTSISVDRYLCPNPPPTAFTTTSGSDLFPVTLNSLSHILFSSILLVKEGERTLSLAHLDEVELALFPFVMMLQHTEKNEQEDYEGVHKRIWEWSVLIFCFSMIHSVLSFTTIVFLLISLKEVLYHSSPPSSIQLLSSDPMSDVCDSVRSQPLSLKDFGVYEKNRNHDGKR